MGALWRWGAPSLTGVLRQVRWLPQAVRGGERRSSREQHLQVAMGPQLDERRRRLVVVALHPVDGVAGEGP